MIFADLLPENDDEEEEEEEKEGEHHEGTRNESIRSI